MEKVKVLLFILLGLGVFIWRMVQKALETTAQEAQQRPRKATTPPALPDASFRQLLEQMQAENKPAVPEATPAGRPLPSTPVPEARSLERPKRRAVSLEKPATERAATPPEPHARRAAGLPRAAAVAPITDYWTQQEARVTAPVPTAADNRRQVLEALRNPASARTAFILSEILRRPA